MQRYVSRFVDNVQSAFRCSVHKVARDFGLAIDGDMLASQPKRVNADQPFAVGKRKAFLEHPFYIQAGIKAKPVQQIGGGALEHTSTNASKDIIGRSALDDEAVDPLRTQQMTE
jgi:hypothetical protein